MSNATILIDLGDRQDGLVLLDNIKYMAQVQGITQKRLFLLGVASYLERTGESPEIIEQIAEYLSKPRKNSRVI